MDILNQTKERGTPESAEHAVTKDSILMIITTFKFTKNIYNSRGRAQNNVQL